MPKKNPAIIWKPRTAQQKACSHINYKSFIHWIDRQGRGVTTCHCGLTLVRSVNKA